MWADAARPLLSYITLDSGNASRPICQPWTKGGLKRFRHSGIRFLRYCGRVIDHSVQASAIQWLLREGGGSPVGMNSRKYLDLDFMLHV